MNVIMCDYENLNFEHRLCAQYSRVSLILQKCFWLEYVQITNYFFQIHVLMLSASGATLLVTTHIVWQFVLEVHLLFRLILMNISIELDLNSLLVGQLVNTSIYFHQTRSIHSNFNMVRVTSLCQISNTSSRTASGDSVQVTCIPRMNQSYAYFSDQPKEVVLTEIQEPIQRPSLRFLFQIYEHSTFSNVTFCLSCFLCPPSKKRGHIALHMAEGRSVCRSIRLQVSPSVTFLFPINNSKTAPPTFFKLVPHINLWY